MLKEWTYWENTGYSPIVPVPQWLPPTKEPVPGSSEEEDDVFYHGDMPGEMSDAYADTMSEDELIISSSKRKR